MVTKHSFMCYLTISLVILLMGRDMITAQTSNQTRLRIAVPPKPGFTEFVKIDKDSETKKLIFSGFSIEVFNLAVSAAVDKSIAFEFVSFSKLDGSMNGTYDDMIKAVSNQEYDGAVGDITIRFTRAQLVDFTVPYTVTGISMLVPIRQQTTKDATSSMIQVIKVSVIVTLVLFFLGVIVLMVVGAVNISRRANRAERDDEDGGKETLGAIRGTKLAMLLWFVVLLLLITFYITSLTSLLTDKSASAPNKSLEELIRTGEKVGYSDASFILDLLMTSGFPKDQLLAYGSQEELQNLLTQGGISVAIGETPYFSVFLAQHCSDYTMFPIPSLHASGFGFAFPKGSQLTQNVSTGIIKLFDNGQLDRIQARTIGGLGTCDVDPVDEVGSGFPETNTFRTLFAGAIFSVVLVIAIYMVYCYTTCKSKQKR